MVKIDKYSLGAGRGQARTIFFDKNPDAYERIALGGKLTDLEKTMLDNLAEFIIKDGYNFTGRVRHGDWKDKNIEGE